MYRKSLALLATGLILFAALLVQMSIAQAAAPSQATPGAAEEPQPLPQPLRIRINQAIPLTISVPASLLAGGAPVTTALTTTGTITEAAGAVGESTPTSPTVAATGAVTRTAAPTVTEELTATGALTEAAELTATETTTAAAEAPAANAEEPLTATAALTESDILTTAMASMPVTLELSLDLVVSNTLTSTVPASVTLQLADLTTRTLPVSITVAPLPDGEVVLELLPAPEVATSEVTPTAEITATPTTEATPAVTTTEEATPTLEVTATVQAPSGLPVVETTATTTANLRAGPATTFDLVGQVGPGATIAVVGISEDGQWYLLDGGTWIATFLAADTQIPNLPIATQELVDQASGTAPVVAATPAVTATSVVTSAVTPAVTATPVPAATTAVTPTTTTDANVRAGPGTEFPIIGGTINGQAINIVGRNADGTWFRLDNTGWIFGELVANPPALDTVPIVNTDGTPVEAPAATPTPTGGGSLPLPTATPAGAATGSTTAEGVASASTGTSAATAAAATGPNAAYIGEVQALIARYDGIAQTMDSLIAEATTNSAALTTPAWADRVSAAVGLLRTTGASVAELQAPAALAGAQQDLVTAAQQYTAAGAALAQAVATGAADQLNVANSSIELANTSLTAVETALAAAQ